jgi:hypothetical protein
MRRFLTVVFVPVAIALFLTACPKKQTLAAKPAVQPAATPVPALVADPNAEPNTPAGKPQIAFENTLHDFGTVPPASNNTCEFKFKNTGTALLKIIDVRATCGCTTPKLEKNEYLPDESGTIHVKYHAANVARADTKHIYVTTNIAENPKVQLTIKANIIPAISVVPDKIELSLRQPNAACPTLIISSNDGIPFAIRQIESTGDCISVEFDSTDQANRFILQPQVDIEKLRQLINLEGVLFIDTTHPNCPSVNVKFTAASEFKVEPQTITILRAEPNKPVLKQVTIHNTYNEPFEIQSVSSRFGITKLQRQVKDSNGSVILDLLITPTPEKNRKNMFSDVVTVKIKNGQTIRINCRGFYAKPPDRPPTTHSQELSAPSAVK